MYKSIFILLVTAVLTLQGVLGDWGYAGDCHSYHQPLAPNLGKKMDHTFTENQNVGSSFLNQHDIWTHDGATVETFYSPNVNYPPAKVHIYLKSDKENIFKIFFQGPYDQVVFNLRALPGGDYCSIWFDNRKMDSVWLY